MTVKQRVPEKKIVKTVQSEESNYIEAKPAKRGLGGRNAGGTPKEPKSGKEGFFTSLCFT